ncbi:MAG: PAS domain S-box protein, partial [Chloroflexi bacterium]|nr:PAS domain S-box protein [Chloroflexota bacterium]
MSRKNKTGNCAVNDISVSNAVLIVEDDKDLLHLIRKGLQRAGFHTEGISSGADALEMMLNEVPELLLLDYRLPDMTGRQLIEKLREKRRVIPFIVFTGQGDEKVAVEMMKLGARDYLVKDSAFLDVLPSVIRQVLRQLALERQLADAEGALKETARKFERLVEDMHDGYFVIQDFNIVYANGRILEMMGYSRDEVIGKHVDELLSLEMTKKLVELHRQRLRGEPVPEQYEFIMTKRDGTECLVEFGARRIAYEDRPAVSVVMRDITERRKAEEALRESEKHYSALVRSLTDAVFKFKGGVVTWCNERVEEIYGYTKDELIGKKAGFFFQQDMNHSKLIDEISASIRESGFFRGTAMVERKDGSVVDIEYTISQITGSAPVELVAVARDITERRQAEVALRESEERLRNYLESSPDGIFVFDSRGTFLYVNRAQCRIADCSREELLGKNFLELPILPPEYWPKATRVLDFNAVGRPTGPDEFELVKKDGSRVFVEVSTYPVVLADKVEAIGIARDITERKRMEEALRQSERNYRVLFESTLDGLIVIDAESGKVVLANQTAADIFGFAGAKEGIGIAPFDFVCPKDRDEVVRIFLEDVLGADLHEIHEFRARTKDGREIWVSAVGTKTEYQGKLAGLVSIRDITERRRVEEEKQRLEEQLRLAGRLAAVGELAAGIAHELNNPLAAVQGYAQFLMASPNLDEKLKRDVEIMYREAQRA